MTERSFLVIVLAALLVCLLLLDLRLSKLEREAVRVQDNAVVVP